MRGQILSFDEVSGAGLISGEDSIRYTFSRDAMVTPGIIAAGQNVDFVPINGQADTIVLLPASVPGSPSATPGVPVDSFDFGNVLFSFNGRIRRQHFWIGWLILFATGIISGMIPFIGFLIALLLIWPNLAILVKRLHDMGHTGWLAAIPFVVGFVGVGAAFAMIGVAAMNNYAAIEAEDPAAILAMMGPALGILGVVGLIQFGFLLWVGLVDTQRGENRYGPNPKGT